MARQRQTEPDAGPTGGETALVLAARNGDASAFDTLVGRYQRRAVSVSYRLLGNVHDALEVSQDAFLRAWRGLASLSEPARFGAWLLRIVVNLSLNFRRDRANRGRPLPLQIQAEADGPSHAPLADPSPTVAPGSNLQAEELHAAVRRELEDLTESQRVALILFSVEQLPQREVAEIMNCSVEAVKWHVFQARRRLRERLAAYLDQT